MRKRYGGIWRALLPTLALVVSCKDSTSPPVPTSITISGATTTFSALGQTAQFTGQVLDQKGKAMAGAVISWSSSAPGVVEIDPTTGFATARGNGAATIRASSGVASGTRDVTVAQVPQGLVKVAGDAQTGTVGEVLPEGLRVRVQDSGGSPIPGVNVSFVVSQGGGSVSAATQTTGPAGESTVTWTLGTRTSEAQEVTASVQALSVSFSAEPEPGPPDAISILGGDEQTGYAMEALPLPVGVRVQDAFGNPTPTVNVLWTVISGGGTLTASSAHTDQSGIARAQWTLGPAAGENTARGMVDGVGWVSFTATGLPNAVISGNVTVTGGFLSPPRVEGAATAPPPTPAPGPTPGGPDSVPGEWLVVFEPAPLGAPSLGAAQYQTPAVSREISRAISMSLETSEAADLFEVEAVSPAGMAAKIQVREGADEEEVAAALRRDPRVRTVEPNYLAYQPPIQEAERASGPQLVESQELFFPLQAWHYEMIQLPEAWEITTGSQSVTVAVVDGGIRFDHWDLSPNITDDGYDFVSDDLVPLCTFGSVSTSGDGDGPDPDPTTPVVYSFLPDFGCVTGEERYGGHGIHVAGTIGAVGGNDGAVGVNWTVKIRPVRVTGTTGSGGLWDIAQGILYAAGLPASVGDSTVQAGSTAHVINLSLGGRNSSDALANAVSAAAAAGSLIIAAAGNDATSLPSYPAAYPEVLSVSAVNPWLELSSFSNYGSWIDIAAPGGQGGGSETWDVFSTVWDFQNMDPFWDFMPGTSMAAPHVSGVAALIFAQNPGMTADQVRQRLLQYARPMGSPTQFGAGLLNALGSLTQGQGLEHHLFVRLVDATSGEEIATVPAGSGGSFRFSHLGDGEYLLFAGLDEGGDAEIGLPGRFWGAYGGTANPGVVEVSGGGVYQASFSLGEPHEQENNGSSSLADYLALGGYMNGSLGNLTDQDWYAVQVPTAGTYTFSTHGWWGACGLAANANTMVELYDAGGGFLGGSDDRDANGFDYCGSLSLNLNPGVYYVRVRGSSSVPFRSLDQGAGWYRVSARRGS